MLFTFSFAFTFPLPFSFLIFSACAYPHFSVGFWKTRPFARFFPFFTSFLFQRKKGVFQKSLWKTKGKARLKLLDIFSLKQGFKERENTSPFPQKTQTVFQSKKRKQRLKKAAYQAVFQSYPQFPPTLLIILLRYIYFI